MSVTVVCPHTDCPRYKHPMKVIDEHPDHVSYICPFDGPGLKPRGCGRGRVVSKQIVGGTRGAGRPADGTRSVVGRGF